MGILGWNSSPSMVTDFFVWTVGNGAETFITIFPTEWPYVRSGNQISVTYSFGIPSLTPTHPNLPIVVLLPTTAINLKGSLIFSSLSPPIGSTRINIVQYGSNTVAFQYEPSGTLATGAVLISSSWTLMFVVTYTVP